MSLQGVIICAAIIAVALIISLIPIFMGASLKRKTVKPAELFPPRGASPIDVLIGYYGRLADPRSLFNPLMLYWAQRGFITIEEDCKRGLKLTKLKDIERPDSEDGFNPCTFELEKSLFERIFSKRKVFYTLGASKYFADFYGKIMDGCKKEAAELVDRKTKIFSVITIILPFVMLFAVALSVGISTGEVLTVILIFPTAAIAFIRGMPHFELEKGSAMTYFMYTFFGTAGCIPFFATLYLMPWQAGVLISAALVVALLILFVINKKIDLRTPEQLKNYARICGFKRFLLLAERAKLEALVEENPEYFYEVLPYCYILGITEKLKKRYDRIIMDGPGWYLGELRDKLMF
ncbi:MAG: DUF2207 domain-containing protein [Clostridia bacterium]|nr:DUF2207 domain-containing protein [Clostridia bacterium]